jgi:hypothetical protein
MGTAMLFPYLFVLVKMDKSTKKRIKDLEKEIQEEKGIWPSIKKAPEKDKGFLSLLRRLLRPHKQKSVKTPKSMKEISEKVFGGLEPPADKKRKEKV